MFETLSRGRRVTTSRSFLNSFLVIVGTLILLVLLFELLGWPFLKTPLTHLMEKQLERSVKIEGPFKIRLLGGIRAQAGSLWISAPQGFSEPHLVSAQEIELKLRYSDLWGIPPEDPYMIKGIQVGRLDARLARLENGDSTWQFSKEKHDAPRPFPIIQSLVVKHGTVNIDDVLTDAKLKIDFNTKEGAAQAQSTSEVKLDGHFRGQPMHGQLTTQGFLPIANQSKDSPPVSSTGWLEYGKVTLKFSGSVYDALGEQKIKGNLHISGSSLGQLGDLFNVTLPTTEAFTIDGDLNKNETGWGVKVTSAKVGRSQLSGDFHYDPRPEKATLNGELKGKRFILADLAPAFGNDPGSPDKDKVFPDKPLNFTSYNRMNANIGVDIDYVDLGKAFREPIAPLKANLNLNKNKLSLAKISAKTATGSLSGTISIDAHEQPATNLNVDQDKPHRPPEWAVDLVLKEIDLGKLIAVSPSREKQFEAGKTQEKSYISGKLNGEIAVKGIGESTSQLLSSLNGEASLHVVDGDISHLAMEGVGIDAAQALGIIIKGDANLPMECAVVNFKAKDGVAFSQLSLIDTPVTMLLLNGDIQLHQEQLNLKMRAYPKNFSPLTARSPILINGTFKHPSVGIKKAPIAARVIGGIGLAVINPFAAIIPFLDPGESDPMKIKECKATAEKIKQRVDESS
ncbi:AsmA family protein [Methylobacillus caricis]|uniref:AsmA family protein n=1 Tax=Methylobacillus caricis TaxID=1971611 RepID=UPI001CFF6C6F|nr:AsmA family protein [Methylobacillus caricis]